MFVHTRDSEKAHTTTESDQGYLTHTRPKAEPHRTETKHQERLSCRTRSAPPVVGRHPCSTKRVTQRSASANVEHECRTPHDGDNAQASRLTTKFQGEASCTVCIQLSVSSRCAGAIASTVIASEMVIGPPQIHVGGASMCGDEHIRERSHQELHASGATRPEHKAKLVIQPKCAGTSLRITARVLASSMSACCRICGEGEKKSLEYGLLCVCLEWRTVGIARHLVLVEKTGGTNLIWLVPLALSRGCVVPV